MSFDVEQVPGVAFGLGQEQEKLHGMLTLLSRLQAGTLGELLTVAKLNSLGHAAYISPEGAHPVTTSS